MLDHGRRRVGWSLLTYWLLEVTSRADVEGWKTFTAL